MAEPRQQEATLEFLIDGSKLAAQTSEICYSAGNSLSHRLQRVTAANAKCNGTNYTSAGRKCGLAESGTN